jgi:hypothetical protein
MVENYGKKDIRRYKKNGSFGAVLFAISIRFRNIFTGKN